MTRNVWREGLRLVGLGLGLAVALPACGGDLTGRRTNGSPIGLWLVPTPDGTIPAGSAPVFTVLIDDDTDSADSLAWSVEWADGTSVAAERTFDGQVATLRLSAPLELGAHTARLRVVDSSGAESVETVDFRVVDPTLPDRDGDGYSDSAAGGTDCDDSDAAFRPGAEELCDGRDNNCDGTIDEGVAPTWYPDTDLDGFGDPTAGVPACRQPVGWLAEGLDCDDNAADIAPGLPERCDGTDNDCDGRIDEDDLGHGWFADADADGHGDPTQPLSTCDPEVGGALDITDCHDGDPTLRWCRSCADVRAVGLGDTDGIYALGADETGAFDAWCDFSARGGDWTLLATNAWTDTWDPRDTVDPHGFGAPSLTTDHKSPGWNTVPFTDLRFESGGGAWAIYADVGDGTLGWLDFVDSVGSPNCGTTGEGTSWPLTEGSLGGDLCDTHLTVNVLAHSNSGECTVDTAGGRQLGWGPTWNAPGYGRVCPHRAPHTTTFATDFTGQGPFGSSTPLRMYVR